MKRTTFSRIALIIAMVILGLQSYAQNYEPFTPRFDEDLKGDIVLIGNNILGPDNNAFNDNSVYNHNVNMQYIDIDADATTFSSSSADLSIADPSCYKIRHASLYWGAVTPGDAPINTVKFKGPTGGYNDIQGTIIFDANGTSIDGGDSFSYACYADVTDIVTNLATDLGTYTVANVSSSEGETALNDPFNGTGNSAGWSLFIVYENPTLPGKSITSFDGFSAISVPGGNTTLDIPIDGFRTVPAPAPVRANFAFATLEGDSPITGDRLRLNGTSLSTVDRPVTNFFNSSVTQLDATPVNDRVPNSTNTLGFDTGVMVVPNPGNSVIANDATSAVVRLETSGDTYFQYFFALAVDIIEPDILLTKIVEDDAGNNITDQVVGLGSSLNYVIRFQNIGNDNATNFQIRDILPINIIYNHPTDLILPAGVTVASYDAATRELILDIEDFLVEEDDPAYEIRIEVQVVDECNQLADACSNIIVNQAFATYNGFFNPDFQITDDPSLNTNTGCLEAPQATNFLADLDCEFIEEIVLCGDSVELTAADGYDSYSWSTSITGTPVIGTGQTITVTDTDTYYSFNTAIAPCQSIIQRFDVSLFGGNTTNPVIPFADEVVTCPNDGKLLPNIFLCGANDSRDIITNITGVSSIIWEQLDEASCDPVIDQDCANEDAACTWNEVGTGPNFVANTAGQFRITINYDGGCFEQFYFNVYQNVLNPTVVATDIICTTPGSITVNDVPNGYEYSLDDVTYQTSNVFTITTPGTYTVYIRQIGVPTNPCVFTVPDVQIRARDFTVSTTVTQPLCFGDKGSIQLAANDVEPQYFFSIYLASTLVNSVGPIVENNYTFENLNPGIYTALIETEDGCSYTEDLEIIEPPLLTVTAALTTPLTCENGEIIIYAEGGTPPYFYYINSTTDFQTVPEYTVTTPGVYDIVVVDSNNCSATTTITVDQIDTPEYNIISTNIDCAGSSDGTITINVTNANGNTLEFSIDGGTTFFNSPVFTGLDAGDYEVVVQYTIGSSVCITDPQTVTITSVGAISGTAELTAPYTCNSNATITVTGVTGGTPPYMYSIDGVNFQASNVFNDLIAGTYTIVVLDDNDCTLITNEITLDPLNPPTDLMFDSSPITCPSNTSTITITGVTGGTGTLEYQIVAPAAAITPFQTSNVFAGLVPDTYTFQVRDENDCVYSESYTIDPITAPRVDVVLTEGLDCTATPDAIITGTITGIAPYTYAVSIDSGAYTSLGATGATFTYTTANPGTYQFQITDANNCIAESSIITVNPVELPSISAVVETQPILCNGDSNGVIDITIDSSTGTPPFTINVFNTTTTTDFGTQTSGLPAGNYTITVTDANSCTTTETIAINEPDAITFNLSKVDITCNDPGGSSLGSITVENVSGGTAPFTYFITNNFGDVIPGNPYSAVSNEDHTFNIINFGIYTINVIDANGCSLTQQIVIASPPSDLLIDVATVVPDCASGGTAVVTAISALGSGNYEFGILEFNTIPYTNTFLPPDTFPGGNTRTFTNLIPGVVYTFVVHDIDTDCYFVKSADTPIDPASTLTSSVIPNNVACQGENNGSVTFTIDNFDSTTTSVDYAIYEAFSNVLIDGPTNLPVTFGTPETVTTPNPGTLAPGQYYIVFTENGTGSFDACQTASVVFEINESAITLDLTTSVDQNANCNPNSGLISAIAQNGTPPYLYQITTTPGSPLETDPNWASASTFNLDTGNYYVHVIDAFGCIISSPVVVLPMDASPIISATVNNICTVTDGNFEIDVSLDSAGIAPYSFSIDGGTLQTLTAPFTISNLFSGTHTIEIQDANGCGNLVSIYIPIPLDIAADVTTSVTCNDDDGEITVNPSGGSGSFTYTIAPNPASINLAGNVFSGVPSGTYIITITDTVTACTNDVTIALSEATPPSFTATPTSVICFGEDSGSFDINVSGFTGTYTYEVFDDFGASVTGIVNANTSTNPLTINGMTAGSFTVVVTQTQNPFCTATSNVIITSPSNTLVLTATETSNVNCNNVNGTITATAEGGWGDYQYELTGSATVPLSPNGTFTNLSAGNYTVNVIDAQGCTDTVNIVLDDPNPIDATFTPSASLLSCFGDQNASITITNVTGGQGVDYSYTLNMLSPTTSTSGPQQSNVFDNLGAGIYSITITDNLECTMTSIDIVINDPTLVEADLVVASTPSCLTDSTITLSATGGTAPYEYSNDINFSTILGTFNTSTTFSVSDGTFQYYVRDANGCVSNLSNEITIDPIADLSISLESDNPTINCTGDNNGSIVATAQGGLGNYVYTLEDTLGNTITATQDSPGVFTELVAGTYVVHVESGDCVEDSEPITITEPTAPLSVDFNVNNITCSGNNDGALEIIASGGTGIIRYAISPQLNQFFETNIFENLAPGNYDAIVQDELGCFEIFNFTITDPIPVILSIVADSLSGETCEGEQDGEFSIDISGGTLPYSVSLDNPDGPFTTGNAGQTIFNFTDLSGGDHIVYIRDAEGCESEWNITFPDTVLINPQLDIEYLCVDNVLSNIVTVTVDEAITDLSQLDYSLDGGPFQESNIFIDVTPGTDHYIEVRHTNGCIQTTEFFDIEDYDPITLTLTQGDSLGEIIATVTGGTPPYQFTLNGVDYGETNVFVVDEEGTYVVVVTDSAGCQAEAAIEIETLGPCIPNYFTPNGDGIQDYWQPGCTEDFPELTFDIFDRYGRKVATYKVGEYWDGRYNGKELPTGDYWYVVMTNNDLVDKEYVGHFTLYR